MPPAKAPSKRSGEAGRKGGGRLGWSLSEARGRPGNFELRRVVDVEKEVAGLVVRRARGAAKRVEKEVTDLVGAEVKRRGGRFCWLRADTKGILGQAVGLWAARGFTTRTSSVGDQTSIGGRFCWLRATPRC